MRVDHDGDRQSPNRPNNQAALLETGKSLRHLPAQDSHREPFGGDAAKDEGEHQHPTLPPNLPPQRTRDHQEQKINRPFQPGERLPHLRFPRTREIHKHGAGEKADHHRRQAKESCHSGSKADGTQQDHVELRICRGLAQYQVTDRGHAAGHAQCDKQPSRAGQLPRNRESLGTKVGGEQQQAYNACKLLQVDEHPHPIHRLRSGSAALQQHGRASGSHGAGEAHDQRVTEESGIERGVRRGHQDRDRQHGNHRGWHEGHQRRGCSQAPGQRV